MNDNQNPIDTQNPANPLNTGFASTTDSTDISAQINTTDPFAPINANNTINTNTSATENIQASNPLPDTFNSTTQFNQEDIITSPHAPQKYGGKKVIATIFGVLLLIAGVTAGVILVQHQQRLEKMASSGAECQQATDCILLDEPGNSGSFSAPGNVSECSITAQNMYTYQQGTSENGCYRVDIDGREVKWQKYGSGSECSDVSNIQVKFQNQTGQTDFMRICHYTSDSSQHPWQAIEISVTAWDKHKLPHGDFVWAGPDEIWPPDPGLSDPTGITEADLWCENNIPPNITPGGAGQTEFIKICHYTSDPSAHNWQAIEVSLQGWSSGHDEAHDYKKTEYDFLYANTDPTCIWPEPGNLGITCADIWCENNTPPPGEEPLITAECSSVKAYDTSWNLLASEELGDLSSGDIVRFTVSGETSSGDIDAARFTINGILGPEVTDLKPGSLEFYYEYTIPPGTDNFAVKGEVHHSELGWF